jgi:hypothetical protein
MAQKKMSLKMAKLIAKIGRDENWKGKHGLTQLEYYEAQERLKKDAKKRRKKLDKIA